MLELGPALSVTVAPLTKAAGGDVRRAIERAGKLGVRLVQLSAAQQGLRPRELDRRARKDVLALLARNGLALGGLDLMIPHRDWLSAATQDRAFEAMLGAAIDPAALLSQDIDPAEAITRFAERLLVARLDDHTATSVATAGGRCPIGQGSLDVLGYRAALSICPWLRSIVIELRDLPDPAAAATAAVQAWSLNIDRHGGT